MMLRAAALRYAATLFFTPLPCFIVISYAIFDFRRYYDFLYTTYYFSVTLASCRAIAAFSLPMPCFFAAFRYYCFDVTLDDAAADEMPPPPCRHAALFFFFAAPCQLDCHAFRFDAATATLMYVAAIIDASMEGFFFFFFLCRCVTLIAA